MANTTKYVIPKMDPNGLVKNGPADVNTALDSIDSKMVGYSEGVLGSRPTSTGGSPGVAGRIYKATDTGFVYRDTGTAWELIGPKAPYAQAGRSASQSIPTGATPTVISLDTEILDSDTMVTIASQPTRITFTTAGLYIVTAYVNLPSITEVQLRSGGSTIVARRKVAAAASGGEDTLTALVLPNNYVEVLVAHGSGSAQNALVTVTAARVTSL